MKLSSSFSSREKRLILYLFGFASIFPLIVVITSIVQDPVPLGYKKRLVRDFMELRGAAYFHPQLLSQDLPGTATFHFFHDPRDGCLYIESNNFPHVRVKMDADKIWSNDDGRWVLKINDYFSSDTLKPAYMQTALGLFRNYREAQQDKWQY